MSESESPTRGDLHHHHQQQQQQQQLHQSSTTTASDDANNSIIGKVKSRVSSIFPQKLTNWFSPSAATAGSPSSNGGVGRRRRRNDDEQHQQGEYERANNSDDEEESNNSAGEETDVSPASTQPPTKRSRLNVETTRTNFKDSQTLLSSTPTSGGRRRLTHLNLYGNQKEPAYNFSQTKTTTNSSRSFITSKNLTVDSADIIDVVPERNLLNTSISSRRSLNIPSTSSSDGYINLHNLKRQPVSSLRAQGVGASPSITSYTPQRTSTTILEIDDDDDDDVDEEGAEETPRNQTIIVEEVDDDDDDEEEDDNEQSEEIAKVTSKKQKFTNGNLVGRSSSVATESGESRSSSVAQVVPRNKSGLLNAGNRGMRTLSGNGLNFYSHLEGRKSLFSEKNMPGMLNNSTLSLTSLNRRQFNSSIYGSTSALSDSRLLNTSSPFYKGQTTYGGAAAYNKFNRTLNQSVRIAPTLIRPTSSLSTLSSSTNSLAQGNDQSSSAISSTAKRILELINDFSTPLNDAKKMASNIKTPAMLASRTIGGKRFSEADLATSRSVRLSSVRTPYTRPTVTLNPSNNESKKLLPPLKELQVPSMSQLLQMKKMQSCTERSRQIANTSKSTLNRETEYKLPGEDDGASGDRSNTKHVSKIKNKVTSSSRVSSKNTNAEDEEAPVPANLPNIAFPFMQSVPKIDIAVKSGITVPPAAGKSDFKFTISAEAKLINNFGGKPAQVVKSSPPPAMVEPSKPAMNFNFGTTSSPGPSTQIATSSEFKFSMPLSLNYTPSKGEVTPINNFKFSSPVMIGGQKEIGKAPSTSSSVLSSTVPQLKTGSVLDALKKPIEKVAPTVSSTAKTPTINTTPVAGWGGQFKKSSNEWECAACMVRNKESVDTCVSCTTPRTKPASQTAPAATPALPLSNSLVKNSFGDAFKPKSDTWECSACMVRNKNEATECVACNTKKPGATTGASADPAAKLQTTDAGFKSLVAKQTASKWECDACMTRNDAERNKCVCCEQAKPGTQVASESAPKFSFGTSSASKFTFGFANAGAKKEDELKAEAATASKTENKPAFTFGIPAKTNAGSTSATNSPASTTGIMFGVPSATQSTSSSANVGKDVPDLVKTNTTGFKFGVQPADSSKTDAAPTPVGFSFGVKTDAKTSSVKFNLPPATDEHSKPATTSAITSTASSTPAAAPSLFNPIATSTFGATKKLEETKQTETTKVTTGFVFGVTASTPASSAATTNSQTVKPPITFGNSFTSSEANKSPPKIMFGSPATTSAASTTSSPSGGFVFGKPVAATATFAKSPSTSTGFAFGKEQTIDASASAPAPSLFGSPVASNSTTSVASKSATPIFGTPAATSNVATAVSSSTSGFVFGKTTTTPMFGTSTAASSTATTSVFGSKPSTLFPGGAASSSSSSTPASTISASTLATNQQPAATSAVSSTPFVFGSGGASAPTNTSQTSKPLFGASPFESGSTATSTTTAASSWPTNTFSFGSNKPAEEAKPNAVPAFGSSASIFGQATPIFGSAQAGEVKPAPTTTFGAPSASISLFGSNASSTSAGSGAAQQTTGNVFGSTSSTPIFGSMSFGAAPTAAAAPAAPTNSTSNPLSTATFGSVGSSTFSSGFGSLAAASSSVSSDGASAPKKADIAFNFGSAHNSGSSGFSFGSNNNNKPPAESVFKFNTSSAPSFNFTGSNESSNATQPFQFAAPTSTPAVYNFSGVEGSNASGAFQFNAVASAAPPNNIFAPTPTPGSQAASQQARRKMRTTIRRIPPR